MTWKHSGKRRWKELLSSRSANAWQLSRNPQSGCMISNVSGQDLDAAFRRVRDLDVSVAEQLRAFADAGRQSNPDFAAAVGLLFGRLPQYRAVTAPPHPADPLPPF